ncbi:MAG: lipid-A-disaccharide synthase [Gammaproteobacteria bacterium]|nr:lipid-A-disaccharide synthase [Gammaproteobacteria bacterium]
MSSGKHCPKSMNNIPLKIMILAGEASGDMYGARLVEAMRAQEPALHFLGMGGTQMRAADVDIRVDAASVAVVGITEVLSQLSIIMKALRTLKQALLDEKPRLLILIDFPDFNFQIAKFAKKHQIKIFYYISPQVWAWRKSRIQTLKKTVDLMAVILPFELELYQKAGVPVCFEGHPLVDEVNTHRVTHQPLPHTHPCIGLLPGSRHSEIQRLMPLLVECAEKLKISYPFAQFILPLAPTLKREDIEAYLQHTTLPLRIVSAPLPQALANCDAAIVASGTATLEVALLALPMVIIYRVKKLSFYLGKLLIKVDHIGLCNLIAGERIVPELIQAEANSTRIVSEIRKILDNEPYRLQMKQKLGQISTRLGPQGATQRIARAALALIK